MIQDKVSFLGYVISAEGRTLDESRVAAVEKFEPHRNAKKLYSFLQFANHYRKFIPEFAKVTHKLRRLLAKDVPFVWTDAHEATVNAIKHALKNPLILASFRPDCPTNVHVDASQTGLGAVLSQTQDGKERIIEYASRSLNEHDRGLLDLQKARALEEVVAARVIQRWFRATFQPWVLAHNDLGTRPASRVAEWTDRYTGALVVTHVEDPDFVWTTEQSDELSFLDASVDERVHEGAEVDGTNIRGSLRCRQAATISSTHILP
ncbi:hypothetical protein MRX96_054045 [Rhipicephalus microplus]